ncbi:MAG: hypothetical protein MUP26_06455, partial [Desulfobulbaceae bacterium]|nr:hypothetical protein [Desulfobulbaceae bacterium]
NSLGTGSGQYGIFGQGQDPDGGSALCHRQQTHTGKSSGKNSSTAQAAEKEARRIQDQFFKAYSVIMSQ